MIAKAQFVSLDGSAMHVASNPVDSAQKVTKTFDHVPAREVVSWARSRNLPISIADSDIPDRDVTLTLTDVDPADVGPLLASAMGLQAKKEGDKYVLCPAGFPEIVAGNFDIPEVPEVPQSAEAVPVPPVEMFAEIPQVFDKIKKEMGVKDLKDIEQADEKTKQRFKELVEKHMGEWSKQFEKKFDSKAFEKHMEAWGKDFAKKFDSPEWKAKMEKLAKEMKAHAGEMKLDGEAMKKLHQQMEQLQKGFADGKTGRSFGFDAKALAELGRHSWLIGPGGQVTVVGPDGKKQVIDLRSKGGDVVITIDKDGTYKVTRPEVKKATKVKSGFDGHTLDIDRHFTMDQDKARKILDSLTDGQKKMMADQGYLTPADLTPAQRELLGDMGDGEFEFAFSIDGKHLRIKNKERKAAGSVGV
ncbi:MAG: hypothetical protein KF857_04865 [Fimbriimonadaceae bacterium]|nr:hypothetical protein [Fimbriimonadaceae bacterium]